MFPSLPNHQFGAAGSRDSALRDCFFPMLKFLNPRARFRQRRFVLSQLVSGSGMLCYKLLEGFLRTFQALHVHSRLLQAALQLSHFIKRATRAGILQVGLRCD